MENRQLLLGVDKYVRFYWKTIDEAKKYAVNKPEKLLQPTKLAENKNKRSLEQAHQK